MTVRPGDEVRLVTPENPHADGKPATVEFLTPWGAILKTGFGSGQFRALFEEMEPAPRVSVVVPVAASTNGHAPPPDERVSDEPCSRCGSQRFIQSGKCKTCAECGEPGGCS